MKSGPHWIDRAVGARVRMRRRELKMSQTVLGGCMSVTFQQIQKYENGANRISASRLYELASALEVPMGWFFEDLPEAPSERVEPKRRSGLSQGGGRRPAPAGSRRGADPRSDRPGP